MILWCLQPVPERRAADRESVQSFKNVLKHPFLGGKSALKYPDSVQTRKVKFHAAVEAGDIETTKRMLQDGGVHASIVLDSATGVAPLHRAARLGNLELVKILIEDGADVNAKTKFGYTPLHWAVTYSHAEIITELIAIPAVDTALKTDRGKTAWDLAADTAGLEQLFYDAAGGHKALKKELERRKRRPVVPDYFRDEIELDPERFNFWAVNEKEYANWEPKAEGGFGAVFGVNDASPPLIVSDGGQPRLFKYVAVKVPKSNGVYELVGEVESLSLLTHINVVQILGMFQGPSPGTDRTEWKMAMEFCPTDLRNMLYKREDAHPEYRDYSVELMCDFAKQIVDGLVYIHAQGKPHLDLKPENILLSKDETEAGTPWVCKIGD
eukprot:COSAG06_NODE_12930_length_1311_cov_1.111386_1_plen_381_part_10